jgi:hypothetical protein
MSTADEVIARLRSLPPEKQRRALEYIESLHREAGGPRPRRRLKGVLSDLNIDITEEDIAEARREMWGAAV